MTALLADAARDALRVFLINNFPTAIAAINTARPQRSVSDGASTGGSRRK